MRFGCLDIGSTWTKAVLVSERGDVLATARHPTVLAEVMQGVDSAIAAVNGKDAELIACSSAGGGLRLAVVGQERLVSVAAGNRVALSSGAKVVYVSAGLLDQAGIAALNAAKPDVVLLVGGTDDGDQSVLLHNAKYLGQSSLRCPIVLAGNTAAQGTARRLLAGKNVVSVSNVLPDVGMLEVNEARAAIGATFLSHVIGGKNLSRSARFSRIVRAVTPDAVLTGVTMLTKGLSSETVIVVDIGGATTDVYSSVSTVDGPEVILEPTVAMPMVRRTVEGDLGVRWSAPDVVTRASAERLISRDEADELQLAARKRADNVAWLSDDLGIDIRLAGLATILAIRRHLSATNYDLGTRGADRIVLSGGVFIDPAVAESVFQMVCDDSMLSPYLSHALVTVDQHQLLAPIGLLSISGNEEIADLLVPNLLV